MPLPSPTTHSPSPASSSSSPPSRRTRVSAQHTLTRVRENQRRHRARQRDRFADLEKRLEVSEQMLADARAEIEALRLERDMANAFACWDLSRHFDAERGVAMEVVETEGPAGGIDEVLDISSPRLSYSDIAGQNMSTALHIASSVVPTGPPPCCADTLPLPATTVPTTLQPPTPECPTCSTRPPPSPSERTTLCAQAFVLISQRNARRLDAELIRLWLGRGYRRALREGEGCRVENGALEGLLEYISGV